MINEEEKRRVAYAMLKWGGSFTRNLAKAILSADSHNTKKLKEAFSEEWEKYKEMELTDTNDK